MSPCLLAVAGMLAGGVIGFAAGAALRAAGVRL